MTTAAERRAAATMPRSGDLPGLGADAVIDLDDGDPNKAESKGRRSQATELVRLTAARFRLLVSTEGKAYAVPHEGPYVAIPLRGPSGLRQRLAALYADAQAGMVPSATGLADALAVLEGQAQRLEPERVELRLADDDDGRIALDLGTADGACVLVTAAGWEVRACSPVLFRRTRLTSPLPVPVAGGDLAGLRGLLNVDEESWWLLVGWLLAALMPWVPTPILAATGEQGTAKSSMVRMLVELIDPSPASLRSCPRDLRQWATAAAASQTVALDNVSSISPWLSDALCRAVTGDGMVDRALYTDDDVNVLSFRRAVLLTSIDSGALSGDLAERLLPVELQRIPPSQRRADADIAATFADVRPAALGGLLDLLVRVLAVLPTVRTTELPRMADFARVLTALDMVMGMSTVDTYASTATATAQNVIESDPFGTAVRELVTEDPAQPSWTGTASELLTRLSPERSPKDWPATAQAIGGRLRKVAPALREGGIEVEFDRSGTVRTITITSRAKNDTGSSRHGRHHRHPERDVDDSSDAYDDPDSPLHLVSEVRA